MAETVFVRSSKTRDYTVIDNHFLRDDTLSAQAKGLMAYLLFLPEDWTIYQSELCRHFSNGRDSIRSITKELEEHGYLLREKLNGEKGRFGGYKFTIIENPLRENRDGLSAAVNPSIPNTNIKPNTNKPISTNSVGPDFPTEESVEKKPKSKKSTYPMEMYKRVIEHYNRNFLTLFPDSTIVSYKVAMGFWKKTFPKFTEEQIHTILDNGMKDDWVIHQAKYSLASMFGPTKSMSLLNNIASVAKNVSSIDQFYTQNKGKEIDYSIDEGTF